MRWFVALFLGIVLLCSSGCQLFGIMAYAVVPPKVKAEYIPPKGKAILILVEDRRNPGALIPEGDALAGFIADDLTAFEIGPIIGTLKLQQLRDSDAELHKRTISEIGKSLGAAQVLYVDVRESYVGTAEGIPLHGRFEGHVRMIDVATGASVYPQHTEARVVIVRTPMSRDFRNTDAAGLRHELLRSAGTEIGRLFHDWVPD